MLSVPCTVRRDRANTEENPELSVDAKLSSQIENLEADVRDLREETHAGFESLSKQLSDLNAKRRCSAWGPVTAVMCRRTITENHLVPTKTTLCSAPDASSRSDNT